MHRALLLLLGLPLLLAMEGPAQEQLLTSLPAKALKEVLEKQGLKVEDERVDREKGEEKQVILAFRLANRKPVILFNFVSDQVLTLRYSVRQPLPLEIINNWNTLSLRSRAWVDAREKLSVVECDLDYAAGVSSKQVQHFLQQFNNTIERFDGVLKKVNVK